MTARRPSGHPGRQRPIAGPGTRGRPWHRAGRPGPPLPRQLSL